MWLRLDEFGSARNLMQNTLDFNVINPVDSQHFTCTCKAIWLTCWVRWAYLLLSLSCGQLSEREGGGGGGGSG